MDCSYVSHGSLGSDGVAWRSSKASDSPEDPREVSTLHVRSLIAPWCMNDPPTVLEKNLTEEKKTDVEGVAVKQTLATQIPANPQAIPALVESTKEAAPIVLSQAAPVSPSDPKPLVDKASSIASHPLNEKK